MVILSRLEFQDLGELVLVGVLPLHTPLLIHVALLRRATAWVGYDRSLLFMSLLRFFIPTSTWRVWLPGRGLLLFKRLLPIEDIAPFDFPIEIR